MACISDAKNITQAVVLLPAALLIQQRGVPEGDEATALADVLAQLVLVGLVKRRCFREENRAEPV